MDGRVASGMAGARRDRRAGRARDSRARGAGGAWILRSQGRELARLPEQQKLLQAAENACEAGHDEGVDGGGHPGAGPLRLDGGV